MTMTDHPKLSQSEIDALFQQAMASSEGGGAQPDGPLTSEEQDALGEIGNISFGSAATSLSTLLQQRVEITTPTVTLYESSHLPSEFPKPFVLVSVEYTEGLKGTNALVVELQDAKTIADLMLGGNGENVADELNELHLSAVAEAMNQMMGGAATAMSQIFNRPINISPPDVRIVDLSNDEWNLGLSGWIVNVSFRMRVGTLIDSTIMQWLPLSFAKEMVQLLLHPGGGAETGAQAASASEMVAAVEEDVSASQPGTAVAAGHPSVSEPLSAAPDVAAGIAAARSKNVQEEHSWTASRGGVEAPQVLRPEFADFTGETMAGVGEPNNLSLLLDVPLHVTVELGRTRRSIRDILHWAPGTVVELDKLAGEPVDILVNNKRVAIGEVVVIDENFGVRVTEIISPVERVKKLQ
jgi:flagellar motor switch protein FliN/FliY